MAAKIKLTRMGMKKQPTYRVVIQEERSKRDGRFIENIGFYNPRTEPPTIVLNQDRMNYWLKVGALPTESVGQLLRTAGITDRYAKYKSDKSGGPQEVPPTPQTPGERPVPASEVNAQAGTPQGEQTAGETPEGTARPMQVSSDDPVEG
jgi:small subunit ribosomal protein S16